MKNKQLFFFLMTLFAPALALAQEAAEAMEAAPVEAVSSGLDIFLTIMMFIGPILAVGLTFVTGLLSKLIGTKVKNEKTAGLLKRLNESISSALGGALEAKSAAIKAAKDPSSPGGSEITKEEWDEIKAEVKKYVMGFWSKKGLGELQKVLGFGEADIDKRIDAAVLNAKKDLG